MGHSRLRCSASQIRPLWVGSQELCHHNLHGIPTWRYFSILENLPKHFQPLWPSPLHHQLQHKAHKSLNSGVHISTKGTKKPNGVAWPYPTESWTCWDIVHRERGLAYFLLLVTFNYLLIHLLNAACFWRTFRSIYLLRKNKIKTMKTFYSK